MSVTEQDRNWLAQRFEGQRHRLRMVAYRMLGSLTEADDAVQDAWLRLSTSDVAAIENLDGWLTTAISRVCVDMLRSRQARREESLDIHSLDLAHRGDGLDPESQAVMADSVANALLVVLETLAPDERLAFVLHDTFAVPFKDIASILRCSPVAARQLASRARRRVRGAAPDLDVDLGRQRAVVDAFVSAVRDGDLEALIAVLDPDVIVRTDQGTLWKIRGSQVAARAALTFAELAQAARPALVNGVAGLVSRRPGEAPAAAMAFAVKRGKIAVIDVIRDPDRLQRLDVAD